MKQTCSHCKRPAPRGPGRVDSEDECPCVALMLTGATMEIVGGKPVPRWHDPEARLAYEKAGSRGEREET